MAAGPPLAEHGAKTALIVNDVLSFGSVMSTCGVGAWHMPLSSVVHRMKACCWGCMTTLLIGPLRRSTAGAAGEPSADSRCKPGYPSSEHGPEPVLRNVKLPMTDPPAP